MPYSGGSSTNTGVLYQNWFLALQFSYAFFEQDYEIYPEALRNDSIFIDDILVKTKTNNIFYSLKFRSPSKNLHWWHRDLVDQKILIDFKNQLVASPESKLYLISECNCYLFSEVFNRARNAIGSADIYDKLVNGHAVSEWEKAKQILDFDDFEMINFAKKVNIQVLPIEEIKYLIKHRFVNITENTLVPELLLSKAIEMSSNKTKVDKDLVNSWFLEKSIQLK